MNDKNNEKSFISRLKHLLTNRNFHRITIGLITLALAFVIVENGAMPEKYKLKLGEKSPYDIDAPKDIINVVETKKLAAQIASNTEPVYIENTESSSGSALENVNEILDMITAERNGINKRLLSSGITLKDSSYGKALDAEIVKAVKKLKESLKAKNLDWSEEQIKTLIEAKETSVNNFIKTARNLISDVLQQEITNENLQPILDEVEKKFDNTSGLNDAFREVGKSLADKFIKPNRIIDVEETNKNKQKAYSEAFENNKVEVKKGTRIINKDQLVTEDAIEMLKELNLLDENRFDSIFALGIFGMLFLLASLIVIYMNHFCRLILYSRSDLILLGFIIILVLTITRFIYVLSPLAIPIFIAAMLFSILLDMKLAIIINFVLIAAISLITKGDMNFIYMSMISGTLSSFIVSRANQRNKLFMAGIVIGVVNMVVVLTLCAVNKNKPEGMDILVAFLNGVGSIIVTIGILPFFESAFNIITPMKLLELSNPNHPLLKRLLMEAPGTYHHSLMVGNLAEVATEAIGGNALLSRVGAYYHDIGKLKRPNFFMENQLSDNPHDRMTANLSTLVITSHTNDGVELAEKHKIPLAIRDIIRQHHGTTLVVYFYHKARKSEKGESVVQDNFRYEGPKPSTKEAAVVMLADSVEAAVRSMLDKTEGKIEGLVRKIIKDKLDDGQLDLCELTLKDLDNIAKGFMKVLSGIFHEREEYPEIKVKTKESEDAFNENNIKETEKKPVPEEGSRESAYTD